MAWTYLILAGLCEVVYAALLKKTQGFTQSLPTDLFLVAVVSIFVLLALAAREIPSEPHMRYIRRRYRRRGNGRHCSLS